jgi:hypothetical protein
MSVNNDGARAGVQVGTSSAKRGTMKSCWRKEFM